MAILKSWVAGDQVLASDINANFSSVGNARLLSLVAAEAITALDPVRIGTYTSDGGALYDTSVSQVGGNSMNITIGANSNRVVFLIVVTTSISTTATFNSVSIPSFTCQSGSSTWLYIFKVIAPTTGTHAFAWTGTTDSAAAYSFYNCDQSTGLDGNNGNQHTTGASLGGSLTPTVEGDILLAAGSSNGGGITGISATPNGITLHPASVSNLRAGHSAPIEGTGVAQTATAVQSGSTDIQLAMVLIKPFTTMTRAVYRANASDATHANGFIGFAESSIAQNATGVIIIGGKVTGLSGLFTANQMYLGNSSGAANLSTSAGTVTRRVGIALNTTDLLITNEW